MVVLQGKSIFEGVAIGRLLFYKRRESKVLRYRVANPQLELRRFETARSVALTQLEALYYKAADEIGRENAMIFEIQKVMLSDELYCNSIRNIILRKKMNAEYAVGKTAEKLYHIFERLSDEYLQERSSDVRDVSVRLLNILSNTDAELACGNEPVIIAADDLVPSETIRLDRSKVLGFVTMRGTVDSHTAILARTMSIPAVIHTGEAPLSEYDGCMAVVDGFSGQVYINPDEKTMENMRVRQQIGLLEDEALMRYRGRENITFDGRHIHLYANIGQPEDVDCAIKYDAGGIGLFRSEFVFMGRPKLPDEEEQFEIYREAVRRMAPRPVTVRLLDISSEKQIPAFAMPEERNPALGCRGIRFCLQRLDILRPQLRALCRASLFGELSIMVPMVVSAEEIRRVRVLLAEIRDELRSESIKFGERIPLGAMIETPAAALISDILAKEADFFSIGTNDLTQYTLAADRLNASMDALYDAHHPAVLRMIQMTVDNGHAQGIPVGICGQLATDLTMTEAFLYMGVDNLSVPPCAVLALRKKITETDTRPFSGKMRGKSIG